MLPANDLRVEVYIRSMSQVMGFEELKKTLARVMPELEYELVYNPDLSTAKQFSDAVKEIHISN